MFYVYGWRLEFVVFIMACGIASWVMLDRILPPNIWKVFNIILIGVSIYLILYYSVLGRTPGELHRFCFTETYYKDYVRDLLMNIFLYFPLGLSASVPIGPWRVLVGFVLSIGIEIWQYQMGTGVAEVTDVLCNTLGVAVGGIGVRREWNKVRKGL